MGHRQFFPSQASSMGCEDIWSHPYPNPQPYPGTAVIGVNPMPYFDITLRSNNLQSSNLCLEIPNGTNHSLRVDTGNFVDPLLHPPASSSSLMLPNYTQGGPSSFEGFAGNPPMDYERVQHPYKRTAIPVAFDSGSNNGHHTAGNSSSLSISSVNLQANAASGPQFMSWDHYSVPAGYRGNNVLPVGEGSERNIRSRQSLVHLGDNGTGANHPGCLPLHIPPASNISGLTAAGQWGHTPAYNQRTIFSGSGNFCEINQSLASSNSTNNSVEIEGRYHHNPLQTRIPSTPLPIPHAPSLRVMSTSRSGYDPSTHSYRAASSYQPAGFAAPLADGRRPGIAVLPPNRHSRPISIVGQSRERSVRPRVIYDRLAPFSHGDQAHSGWVSEERTFYDSRNLFDQHRDMRLDIDNMSYEELLALEERIGSVSTGLPGESVSSCLIETVYASSDQLDNDEERNCVICLEKFRNKEYVGRLSCKHDFHSDCIKKWLSIKNACPICKAPAVPDSLKES